MHEEHIPIWRGSAFEEEASSNWNIFQFQVRHLLTSFLEGDIIIVLNANNAQGARCTVLYCDFENPIPFCFVRNMKIEW